MLDLKTTDPRELNRTLPPPFRWTAAVTLAAGSAYCLVLIINVLRRPGTEANPAYFVAFVGSVAAFAAFLSIKLFRGDRIARPVDRPPRRWVVRLLGLPVFLFVGISALLSNTLHERIELGLMALTGLGWLLWPRRFLPTATNEPSARARRWIGDFLRRNWDPIGADTRPGEFGAYVAEVERLVGSQVSPRDLAEYLARVETQRLGYQDTEPKMLVAVAKKLLRLNVSSGGGDPAV